MGIGSSASLRLVMGNGSTASLGLGMAMAPLLPQGRGSAGGFSLGWGRVRPPPYVFLGGGTEKPTVSLGGPLPKKRVALRASPWLAAVRLAAMLVCWREI